MGQAANALNINTVCVVKKEDRDSTVNNLKTRIECKFEVECFIRLTPRNDT